MIARAALAGLLAMGGAASAQDLLPITRGGYVAEDTACDQAGLMDWLYYDGRNLDTYRTTGVVVAMSAVGNDRFRLRIDRRDRDPDYAGLVDVDLQVLGPERFAITPYGRGGPDGQLMGYNLCDRKTGAEGPAPAGAAPVMANPWQSKKWSPYPAYETCDEFDFVCVVLACQRGGQMMVGVSSSEFDMPAGVPAELRFDAQRVRLTTPAPAPDNTVFWSIDAGQAVVIGATTEIGVTIPGVGGGEIRFQAQGAAAALDGLRSVCNG